MEDESLEAMMVCFVFFSQIWCQGFSVVNLRHTQKTCSQTEITLVSCKSNNKVHLTKEMEKLYECDMMNRFTFVEVKTL